MAVLPLPYCGQPPLPSDLWGRWNFDPVVLAALFAIGAAYWAGCGRADRNQRRAFCLGYVALFVAFVSPLCALTSALFAARSAHHLLLVSVAAPLIGYAGLAGNRFPPLGVAAAFHILIFWLWHVPAAYQAALSSDLVYWAMQLSLLGSASLFWSALFRGASIAGEVATLMAVIVQMGLLGALLTFAPTPLYAPHLLTTSPFGLTPLEDQQIAGLIMWVASLPLYIAAAVPVLARRVSLRQAVA